MKILRASIILLFLQSFCIAVQPVLKQTPKPTIKIKSDSIKSKDTIIYSDSIDALITKHYSSLLATIDWYYKYKAIPGLTYRYIPLALFPYFCYRVDLLPKDKPIIFFDSFRYNLMQLKLNPLGGELVAIATVSYVKRKNKSPEIMTYRLNFYEYSAVTDEWKKSEYTTSIDFVLTKEGFYVNK